jgi:hypothetical protein
MPQRKKQIAPSWLWMTAPRPRASQSVSKSSTWMDQKITETQKYGGQRLDEAPKIQIENVNRG